METKRGTLGVLLVCLVVILLSGAGIVWAFATEMLYPHIQMDGLLLVMVCLLMGGIFSLMLFLLAKEQGWLPRKRTEAAIQPQAQAGAQLANSPRASEARPGGAGK